MTQYRIIFLKMKKEISRLDEENKKLERKFAPIRAENMRFKNDLYKHRFERVKL
jgi:hypothetical protein